MAIDLLNKPNTEGTSVDYPYGNIKDDTGSNNGTPVNKEVYADFHQFFAKLMAEAGISYNNVPDNFTNGFQYFLSLLKLIKDTIDSYMKEYEDISGSVTLHANLSNIGLTKVIRKYKDDTILVHVNALVSSTISASSALISGLPSMSAGFVPAEAYYIDNSGVANSIIVEILAGVVYNQTTITHSGSDQFQIYLIYKKA